MPDHLSSPRSPSGGAPAPPLGHVAHRLSCPLVDILSLSIDHPPDRIRQPDDPGNEAVSRLADAPGASSTSGGWEGGAL